MATVLAIVAGGESMPLMNIVSPCGRSVELRRDARWLLDNAGEVTYDLLVLAGMPIDEQQAVAAAVQAHRRWRLVPILFVLDPERPGFTVPAAFRADMDGLMRGRFLSPEVMRRLESLSREGAGADELIVSGTIEFDPSRGQLRCEASVVAFTDREGEILSLLMATPSRLVTAPEIIERAWGAAADAQSLQILRRHISNIRGKLGPTPAAHAVRTVRGMGYVFEPLAVRPSL